MGRRCIGIDEAVNEGIASGISDFFTGTLPGIGVGGLDRLIDGVLALLLKDFARLALHLGVGLVSLEILGDTRRQSHGLAEM